MSGLQTTSADDPPPSAIGPVLKLFQSGKLPPARQPAVVEMICNRGNEYDLKVIFDRVVSPDGFAPDLRLKAIGWMADASTTRKVKPAGDLSALTQMAESKDQAVQLAAIRLASLWKVGSISKSLQAIAVSDKSAPALRKAAIDGLIAIGDETSKETLLKLATSSASIPLRMQAAAGLTGLDLQIAADQAAAALAAATPLDEPDAMLDAFFNRKDGPDKLASSLKSKTLTTDVAKRALRYMYAVGRNDAALSAVLSEAAGVATDPPLPTPEEIAQLSADVIRKGDAARGERIFRRADVSCMRCHSVSRAGGQVGPDLSALGGSSPVDYIVNSILNPNLAVKEQYVTKVFILSSGMVLTGVVIDRDDTRVRIRDAQGKTIAIPTADIDEEVEGKSLMPQGITKFLTRDEVVDLAKFVSELGKPGPYAIRQVPSIQRWRVLKQPAKELTEDVPHLENIRQFVFGSQPEEWLPAYAKVGGALPLDELRKGNSPAVAILQGEIQVNEPGRLTFQVRTTETAQVWVDSETFASQSEFTAALEAGRHTVTVRVEISSREFPELRIDVTKPADSTAQFEVVGGM